MAGSGSITSVGGTNTLTTQLTGLTNHALLVGAGTTTITKLTVGGTGELLVGAAGADPAFATSAVGNFSFTSTTAGATRSLTISNTDNTNAASHALSQITTGGASSGDPFQTFTVTGATSWSHGIDNSVSDTYVIAASTALGTSNALTISTAGLVTLPLGDLSITRSSAGGNVTSDLTNSDNTNAGSAAIFTTSVGGTSGGSPMHVFNIPSGSPWTIGVDNGDGDRFALAQSNAALATNPVLLATTAGEITMPLQPAFLATHSVAQDNVTGNGTLVTVNFTTEVFDQNSDYNATNTFTAPVTGRYSFYSSISVSGLTALATSSESSFVTSNRDIATNNYNIGGMRNAANATTLPLSCIVDMDAADTCVVKIVVTGEVGDTDDIAADVRVTWFGGHLVC